jgi:putative ABC transport system permease protein
MRRLDALDQALSNLWKKRLRTCLTVLGVMIGVGALVCMFAFGKGMQRNIRQEFESMGLFNYINVRPAEHNPVRDVNEDQDTNQTPLLDEAFIQRVSRLPGVVTAFAEIRFPALVRMGGREEFTLVQVLPASVCDSGLIKFRVGRAYDPKRTDGLIITDELLRRFRITHPEQALGQDMELATLTVDPSKFNPLALLSMLQGKTLPFQTEAHALNIVGVAGRMGFSGFIPLRSDVFISPAAADRMKKINITHLSDLFAVTNTLQAHERVTVKVESPLDVDAVRREIEDWGFLTSAPIDQFTEMKKGFIIVDAFLLALGMIGITVSCLSITNTMVMSILEHTRDIGIMKAVGATDRDVGAIFVYESGVIGFLGGVLGLDLAWLVSLFINQIINGITAREGVPYMNHFAFPMWLCLSGIGFSMIVSVIAGVYPALRAARVDPIVALRRE